ncbi:hypothetical protein [Hymenobacter elongatus]|uniref:8-amino-7-oxononanoate synthase n=1 Tax=Hymenobacter elongatus TaxID=877208 RepID=A0A4Z0PRX7_9BACT|nr:hypothetical protein [Hymenobacter elongatus]TGE20054.1 hypothetical protein E5J99_00355 [Hymenobacter elongatus]
MNREIRFDAHQISLGDNAVLALELRAETSSLEAELRDTDSIDLIFDHQRKGSAAQVFTFTYTIVGNVFTLTPKVIPGNDDTSFERLMFLKNGVLTDVTTPGATITFPLANTDVIEIQWQAEEWEEEGVFLVKGNVYKKDVPNGVQLDFGPARLVVSDGEVEQPVRVTMNEAKREETADQGLWGLIRNRALNFNHYRAFVDSVLCVQRPQPVNRGDFSAPPTSIAPFNRLASYAMLKHATEMYLMQESGLALSASDFQNGNPASGTSKNLNKSSRRRNLEEARRLGPGGANSLNEMREEYLEQLELEEGRVLPYFKLIREKLSEVPLKNLSDFGGSQVDVCYGILKSKLQAPPLLELIWSYWHEEGGLVQTMNALSLRFQNVRQGNGHGDPLANLNLDPLRPLSNLMWGYIEDERNRLTLNRRNLEYQYEYGIGLIGRAVQSIPVAEHRTFFLRGFHSLLRAATEFYQQANYTTVIPDGFPVLNHLREVHLVLAEGAHNQYGDLPWTARAEMLTQQWLLARPEVREFLGGRIMVPYTEPWMDRVDNMKQLQGWNPANVSHFHDLGAFGEQLLLSIRYGAWNSPTTGATNAANWAYYWREEIQRYIHAYKAVTGVDLASDIVDARLNMPDNEERYLQPAQLIERQTALQQQQLHRNRQLSGPLVSPGFGQPLPGRVPLPRHNGYLE